MKIKFNSNDNLPLNKPLKFHNMTIIIRCVFSEDGKSYPQFFLDDTLYDPSSLKNHYWFFKDDGFKFEEHVCNGSHGSFFKKYSDIERKRSYF